MASAQAYGLVVETFETHAKGGMALRVMPNKDNDAISRTSQGDSPDKPRKRYRNADYSRRDRGKGKEEKKAMLILVL